MARHDDDSQMSRFEREGLDRFSAKQAVAAIALVAGILILCAGGALRHAGEEMEDGWERSLLMAVGKPTDVIADNLPFQDATGDATAGLSPDADLSAQAGFSDAGLTTAAGKLPPITPDYFDPQALGENVPKRELQTLLVTGDSLSTPLDLELARKLADEGVTVERAPQLGTGISNDALVDWAQLSAQLTDDNDPSAVVIFIGANEGYPLPGANGTEVNCCGPVWAASFAGRARQMMDNFRQAGETRVYWLLVPTQRDPARGPITDAVNAAVSVAAQPWRNQIELVDLPSIFTPNNEYRASMDIDGENTIVRESDGIHLNEVGAEYAADIVLDAIDEDFTYPGG
jgi:lysophospholipase L1-like esterase